MERTRRCDESTILFKGWAAAALGSNDMPSFFVKDGDGAAYPTQRSFGCKASAW